MSIRPSGCSGPLASARVQFQALTRLQQDQSQTADARLRQGEAFEEAMNNYIAASQSRQEAVSGNRHEADLARARALMTRMQQTDRRDIQACQTLEAELVEGLDAMRSHYYEGHELVRLTVLGPHQMNQTQACTHIRRSDPLGHVMTFFLQKFHRHALPHTIFQFFVAGSDANTPRLVRPSDTLRDLRLTSPRATMRMSIHARTLSISRPPPVTQDLPRAPGDNQTPGNVFKVAVLSPPAQPVAAATTTPQTAPRQAVLPQAASAGAGSAPTAQPFGGAASHVQLPLLGLRAGRLVARSDVLLVACADTTSYCVYTDALTMCTGYRRGVTSG